MEEKHRNHQRIVELYASGTKPSDIAKTLDISVNAVRSYLKTHY